jgi:drug/metabolite transporter (DMT)-like permease
MQITVLAMILVSVLLTSASQILLKIGVSAPSAQQALQLHDGLLPAILALALNPMVVAGLACFALSAVFWIFVLSKIDVSMAYPCVALGVVITVLAGYFLLGETISAARAAGVGAIVVGVLLVAAG